ncbi:MAG: phosphatase PAP2 family protein [Lentisphaeria bacterium]|nr:phosphatase PAP2 family protein [Candidatus Neomarinimicrobiota bacterium]MCF7842582.1 phosphatase PAP2 family protein [Lentisphaeria bacterium]
MTNHLKALGRRIQGLRIEEVIFLIFLIPSLIITLRANWYFYTTPGERSVKIEGGLWRIGITIVLLLVFYWFLWYRPDKRMFRFIRDIAPFLFAILIYTNLHDTIHFVNPHDVHYQLNAIDEWMFGGVSPTVWAEQFYKPWLTDWLSFAYMNYFWITVILVLVLYFKKEHRQFRTIMLTMILCYYFGYLLYIIFPAAPPRLAIADQYTINIYKGTSLVSDGARALVHISASSARGAFPSLHCAITFMTLGMAWRFHKGLFWPFLPIGISLITATVYLRHHYVIDIIAGLALCVFAWYVTPGLDRWWRNRQKRQGIISKSPPVLKPGEK